MLWVVCAAAAVSNSVMQLLTTLPQKHLVDKRRPHLLFRSPAYVLTYLFIDLSIPAKICTPHYTRLYSMQRDPHYQRRHTSRYSTEVDTALEEQL